MRALVQRVSQASVRSEGEQTGSIGEGLVALVGVTHADDEATVVRLADKIANLRVFNDDDGRMNRSVLDVGGAVLVVSQFTLYGDARKGRRPSYVDAAPPEQAEPLVERLVAALTERGVAVATGRFQTHMEVELTNDGPVTLMLEV
ncbi:MAG: D-aminoacyl-tRNA deacylase [Nitriliruptorales bacterium]|nr:D-aminoacyl-tRNA deacylase [Nitriliruptorales bacterium]